MYAIKIIEDAAGLDPSHNDQYVVDADIERLFEPDWLTTTGDIAKAKQFESLTDAILYWKRQSTKIPLRDDGKPNRPLTAYTIEPTRVPEPAVRVRFSE